MRSERPYPRGVHFDPTKPRPWTARLRKKNLGRFGTMAEAEKARKDAEAALKARGDFLWKRMR